MYVLSVPYSISSHSSSGIQPCQHLLQSLEQRVCRRGVRLKSHGTAGRGQRLEGERDGVGFARAEGLGSAGVQRGQGWQRKKEEGPGKEGMEQS